MKVLFEYSSAVIEIEDARSGGSAQNLDIAINKLQNSVGDKCEYHRKEEGGREINMSIWKRALMSFGIIHLVTEKSSTHVRQISMLFKIYTHLHHLHHHHHHHPHHLLIQILSRF